jgi:hypothetical protein
VLFAWSLEKNKLFKAHGEDFLRSCVFKNKKIASEKILTLSEKYLIQK